MRKRKIVAPGRLNPARSGDSLWKKSGHRVQPDNRPDLSQRHILALAAALTAVLLAVLLLPAWPAPGSRAGQICAALGALLLLAPLTFLLIKRSDAAASPPAWFIAHALAATLGACLVLVHAAAGDWWSPPGIVLLLLVFLILQGSLIRALLARGFSLLFAGASDARGFSAPPALDKVQLQRVIEAKQALLQHLDAGADEALFSPALRHWTRQPLRSLRYQWLAEREARMVGARAGAGVVLGWSRRIHMLAALFFYLGLLAHVIVVLFFAGYASGGEPIDWWHITAWGN